MDGECNAEAAGKMRQNVRQKRPASSALTGMQAVLCTRAGIFNVIRYMKSAQEYSVEIIRSVSTDTAPPLQKGLSRMKTVC
ncbi:Uncharacterised protein [Salmonella enterica subsp. salamae]|uniref:Uncharacterized protein n=2 Tax=Salmonella enterica TaxID=28901 RepID=A0A379SFC6_SALER|nr:Uncharacterised protein [Salmonella enterica]SUJ07999.1 Uncharacterised protein [Salmonella enterica subsp. salamae]SUJ10038.1 Uncharacterised protein [Salmonella enterica subsp. salamae]